MSQKNASFDDLAALRKQAVNDDPHNEREAERKSRPDKKATSKKPKAKPLRKKPIEGKGREKVSATLSPAAIDALREIGLFLINECDERRMNTSAVMDVALQLAASDLKSKKDKVMSILTGLVETDNRRKSA
jgi:hypothetical protein